MSKMLCGDWPLDRTSTFDAMVFISVADNFNDDALYRHKYAFR